MSSISLLVGTAFIHVATSTHLESRNEALDSIRWLNGHVPAVVHQVMLDSTAAYLRKDVAEEAEQESPAAKEGRLANLLSALSSFPDDTPSPTREKLLTQWVVVAHHASASKFCILFFSP